MTTRTRYTVQRSHTEYYNPVSGWQFGVNYGSQRVPREIIIEQKSGRSVTAVSHFKLVSAANGRTGQIPGGPSWTYANHHIIPIDSALPTDLSALISKHTASMALGQYGPSDFEILPFLLELDETLAFFTKKFWANLSYGAITWGIMPFISDLKALFSALQTINNRGRYPFCQYVQRLRKITWENPNPVSTYSYTPQYWSCEGYTSFTGRVEYKPPNLDPMISKGLFLLDQIGFHPDLSTAWDLLPMSFVVDYFLPIGSLLESIHPRGWQASYVTLDGWFATKLNLEASIKWAYNPPSTSIWTPDQGGCVTARHQRYTRVRTVSSAGSFQEPLQWQTPSFKEIFNTAYLTTFLKRHF